MRLRAPTQPLSTRRAILIVLAVAAAVRLLALASTPLIVTWDGMEYIGAAMRLLHGKNVLSPYRTPGYPLLLMIPIGLGGPSAIGVLVLNHAMGIISSGLVAWSVARSAGARLALIAGLLFAIEPWLLVFESHALTETAASAAAVLIAALAIGLRRPTLGAAAGLGVALGWGCLIRPALQAFVPFVGIGWIAARAGNDPRRRALVPAIVLAMAGGAGVTVAPWLIYNATRGVPGLASGTGMVAWYGLTRTGLIGEPPEYVPQPMAEAFAKTIKPGKPNSDPDAWGFFGKTRAVFDLDVQRTLTRWWRDTLTAHPRRYLRAAAYALLWQLNVFIPSGPVPASDQGWWMRRFSEDARTYGQDAPNFNGMVGAPAMEPFRMHQSTGGVLHRFYAWYSVHAIPGVPQVPLAIGALGTLVVGIRRRDWALIGLIAATFAFIAAHALMLLPIPRYGNPAWAAWYVAVPALFRGRWGDRVPPAESAGVEPIPGAAESAEAI